MKRVLLILTSLILIAGIPVAVFFIKRNSDLRTRATPATTLSFQPAMLTKEAGDLFSVNVVIDTGQNAVYMAVLEVAYDPNIILAESITAGLALPLTQVAGDVITPGKATITLRSQSDVEPFTGQEILAKIEFRALSPSNGPTSVTINETASMVIPDTSRDPETNVLQSTTPARITVSGSAAPTPTPTLSPEDEARLSGDDDSEATGSAGNTTSDNTLDENDDSESSNSGTANGSAQVTISSPTAASGVTNSLPVISGTAPPGSTVTITIYSNPITAVVTADTAGNWTYTPENPLDPGPHDLVVTAQAADGSSYSATESFVVAGGTGENVESEGGVPVSGDVSFLLSLLSVGLALIGAGSYLSRKKPA